MVNPPVGTPYAPYPPTAPAPPMMMVQPKTSGKAITALVLGLVSLCFYIGIVTGIIAIVFAVLAMKDINKNPQMVKGKGMAVAGLILGIVFAIISLLVYILVGASIGMIQECLDNPDKPGCEGFQSAPPSFQPGGLSIGLFAPFALGLRPRPRLVPA